MSPSLIPAFSRSSKIPVFFKNFWKKSNPFSEFKVGITKHFFNSWSFYYISTIICSCNSVRQVTVAWYSISNSFWKTTGAESTVFNRSFTCHNSSFTPCLLTAEIGNTLMPFGSNSAFNLAMMSLESSSEKQASILLAAIT